MRKLIKTTRLVAAIAATVAIAACSSVLDTEPYDRIPANQQIVDAATAQAALVGAYAQLEASGMYGLDLVLLGEMPSDNASWEARTNFSVRSPAIRSTPTIPKYSTCGRRCTGRSIAIT